MSDRTKLEHASKQEPLHASIWAHVFELFHTGEVFHTCAPVSRKFLAGASLVKVLTFNPLDRSFIEEFLNMTNNAIDEAFLPGDVVTDFFTEGFSMRALFDDLDVQLVEITGMEDDKLMLGVDVLVPPGDDHLTGEGPDRQIAVNLDAAEEELKNAVELSETLPCAVLKETEEGTLVKVKMKTADSDFMCEMDEEVTSPALEKLFHKFLHKPATEGVSHGRNLATELFIKLNGLIDGIGGEPDYHPGTDGVVRDIVHPSLYPLIRKLACKFGHGCSRKNPEHFAEYAHPLAKLRALPAGHPHRVEAGAEAPKEFLAAAPESASDGPKADMWGRPYESSVYQWLPTEVTVLSDGSCKFDSYINNLPREQHALYGALESLLSLSIPHLEVAWSYGKTIEFYDGNEEVLCDMGEDLREYLPQRVSLRGKQLQVIVKIADFELAPGATHEGVWHVEGMSHENIVASALHVLRKDPSLQGGDLRFKRAFFQDEAAHIFMSIAQCRPPACEKLIETGLLPVGSVSLPAGRSLAFPNSHVHKLSKITNTGSEPAKRRIVVFWLVNPEIRIPSTQDVPPQQSVMSLDEAKEHRLKLMEERKKHKQDWNVREISLCEH